MTLERMALAILLMALSRPGVAATHVPDPRFERLAIADSAGGVHEASVESPEPTPVPTPASPPRTFAVYALSRGKGVPPEAREAQRKVREMAEADRSRGVGVRVQTTRIGIEGETRLCVEYEDPRAAAPALERARELVRGVDLTEFKIEPCESGDGKGGGQP